MGISDNKQADIAAFYDYGNGLTKIHVWESNGSSFSVSERWTGTSYTSTNITGRVFSSLTGSSIGAIYDYGSSTNKMNLFKFHSPLFQNPHFDAYDKYFPSPSRYAEAFNQELSKAEKMKEDFLAETSIIKIYPNPNNGNFSVNVSNIDKFASISVLNLLGEEVFTNKINSNTCKIDITNEPKGIYIVKTIIGDETFVEKIIYK